MKKWKLWLPDVVVVVLFVVISFAYFFPADIEGRVLYRHDSSAGRGAGQEAVEYQQRTGERTRWTNALFGGMPTYQMSPSYPSTTLLSKVESVYHLGLPENVWYVFVYLLGFYILLRAFDFRVYLAVLHHHRCRTYLESNGAGLSTANDCGCGVGFPRQVPVGIACYSALCCLRGVG